MTPALSEIVMAALRNRRHRYRRLPTEEDAVAVLRTVPIGIMCSDKAEQIDILSHRISNYERDHLLISWDFDAYPYGTA